MAFLHRPLLRKTVRLGKTDESKKITVNVHLRRRPGHDPVPTFDDYLYGPPRVRLSEAEFAWRFGADPDDIAAVRAHFSQFGFAISHHMAARRVYLTGTVGQHNRAFQVDLHDYKFPHAHAHADAPYIPDHLSHVVMRLHGLHLVKFRPHILHPGNRPYTGGLNPPGYNVALLTPQIVAGCYQFPTGHTGAGQAIGIFINFGEAPGSMSLVDETCANYGIATPPTPIWLSVDGSAPPTTDTGDGWTQENVLDVTMCAMFAPGAVLANIAISNSDDYYVRLAHPHSGDPIFTIGSNSSGVSEEDVITTDSTAGTIFNNYDDTYQDCAIQGVTVCNSSGDWGNSADPWNDPSQINEPAAPNNVVAGYPGTDPYVLDVGGTSLGPAAGGTIPTPTSLVEWVNGNAPTAPTPGETLSTASGGGVSILYPVPSYQLSASIPAGLNTSQNPSFFGGTAGRGVPDLCANWGMDIFIQEGSGSFGDVGGTSMSCPIVASLIACVNSALGWNVGFINPILYSLNGNTSIIRRISPGGPANNTVWSFNLQNPTAPIQIQNLPAYPTSSTAWSACSGLGVLLGQAFVSYLQSVKNVVHITGIVLTAATIPENAPFGTVVGSISVPTTGGTFSGSVAIGGGIDETGTVYPPGPDGQYFSIFGNNLVVNATSLIPLPNQASFSFHLVAIQAGAVGSPFVVPITVNVSGASQPTVSGSFTIPNPLTVQINTPFTVTGTLSGYSSPGTLNYTNDNSGWLALPAGSTVTTTSFSFTDPGYSTTGSHSVSIEDANQTAFSISAGISVIPAVSVGTVRYIVKQGTSPSGPFTAVSGSPFTSPSCTISGETPNTTYYVQITAQDTLLGISSPPAVFGGYTAVSGAAIVINPIVGATQAASFTVTGTMSGMTGVPTLTYIDDAALATVTGVSPTETQTTIALTWTPDTDPGSVGIPASGVTTTQFSFSHPALAFGPHTLLVTNGTVSATVSYNVGGSPTVRNWAQYPGADGMYWSLPMQTTAKIITSGALITALRQGTPNVRQPPNYCVPWVVAGTNDPLCSISDGTYTITVRIPVGTVAENIDAGDNSLGGTDSTQPYLGWTANGVIIDGSSGNATRAGSVITCSGMQVYDCTGPVMEDAVTGLTNTAGSDNAIGNLPEFELQAALSSGSYVPPHTIACSLDFSQVNSNAHAWPIINTDTGNTGPIPEGVTICIPHGTVRPTGQTRGFYLLWDILQQFGMLVYNVNGSGAISCETYPVSAPTIALSNDMNASFPTVMASAGILAYDGSSGSQTSAATAKGMVGGVRADAFPAPALIDLSDTGGTRVLPSTFGAWYATNLGFFYNTIG